MKDLDGLSDMHETALKLIHLLHLEHFMPEEIKAQPQLDLL